MSTPDRTWLAPASQLAPPRPLTTLVRRERLRAELDRGAELPLTVVVAPAGSGKSVLVAAWARERCPYPYAWLTLDAADPGGELFWPMLIAAVCASPAVAQDSPLRELVPDPLGVDAGFVRAVAAALATIEGPLVLVIDDLQFLTDAGALENLDALVAMLPPQIRLIVCSRRDPPLSIQRLRVEGALVEIRAADLAFAPDEARALLAAHHVELGHEDLASLLKRTEGWAAGLRLAALSLEHAPDQHAFVHDFAGDDGAVADYLTEQVLARQPGDVRDFLLRTSVPARITGSLADALTGKGGGHERLLALQRADLLITALDPKRTWFRYHALLRELLRSQLNQRLGDEVTTLHARAAHWFAERGLVRDALMHAIQAQDWELATDLIAERWLVLLMDGQGGTVATALARLPPEVIVDSPQCELAFAVGLLTESGAIEQAEARIEHAAENAGRVPPARRDAFDRDLTVARTYARRMRGHVDATVAAAADLAPQGAATAEDLAVRAAVMLNVGVVRFFSMDPGPARETLEQALDLARRANRDFIVVGALAILAGLELTTGRLSRAEQLGEEAVAIAERHGWRESARMASAYAALAAVAHERGDLASAATWLELARAAAAGSPEPVNAGAVAIVEARYLLAAGDPEGGLRALGAGARELARMSEPSWMERFGQGLTLLLLIEADRPAEAHALIQQLGPAALDRLEVAVAAGRLALDDGDPERTLDLIENAAAHESGAFLFVIDAAVLEALAHERLGDMAAAAAAMERALATAELERIVQPILDFGPAAGRLLDRVVRHGTAHRALVDELQDRLRGSAPVTAGPVDAGVEPLTERELAILRYLPTAMSIAEIAAELFVSPNTVKTHVRHTYAKLDVSRRSDAVARARELGLIGGGAAGATRTTADLA